MQTPALLLLARVMRHLGSEAALLGRNIERAFATAGRNVRAAIRRLAVRTRPATRDKNPLPTDPVPLAGLATIAASTVTPAPPLPEPAPGRARDASQPLPLFPPPPSPPLLPRPAVQCVPPPLPSVLPPPPPPLLAQARVSGSGQQDPFDPLPMREIPVLPPPPSASAVWLARQVLWPTVPRGIPARSGRRLSSDSSSSDSSSGSSSESYAEGRGENGARPWPAKPPMTRTVSTIFPRTAPAAAHPASASRSGSDETWEQVSDDDDDDDDDDDGDKGDSQVHATIMGEGSSGRSASNDSELGAWVIQDSDL